MRNEVDEKPHLIYDKTTKKLKLQTNGLRDGSTNETSITLLNSFNGKRVVFWRTKKGTGSDLTVKASVSNYSGTLTLSSALASQSINTFRISSEDATIYRIMYSPNFYDLDSHSLCTAAPPLKKIGKERLCSGIILHKLSKVIYADQNFRGSHFCRGGFQYGGRSGRVPSCIRESLRHF